MTFTLYRAREIIDGRSVLTPRTPIQQRHKVHAFLERWEQHCKELSASRCIPESYVSMFDAFCLLQERYLHKDNALPIGCRPIDTLYLTAMETKLRGRCLPITYQSPVKLDPHWYDICETYLALNYFRTQDDEGFRQLSSLVDAVFSQGDSTVFPKVYVDAFSDLMVNISYYNEREVLHYAKDPFLQSFRVLIRSLYAAIHAY